MGCDIHLYVEVKQGDGTWKAADEWITDEDGWLHVPYGKKYYDERNYDLFAILADVRNGRGFAGIKTGEGFNPISLPKGLPEDVSPQVKKCSDNWGVDGHSHSWHTIADLLAYDWNQTTTLRGIVDANTYLEWKLSNRVFPESWCGAIGGPDVKVIDEESMNTLVKAYAPSLKRLDGYYCDVTWEVTYRQSALYFVETVLPKLQLLGSPENVRIVFWFDN
jgi:hypothetical protein